MAVPIQVVIEDGPDDGGGEGPRAQVPAEGGRAREEDGRVPEVEAGPGEPPVEEPDGRRRRAPDQEAVQHGAEVRGSEEPPRPHERVHDALGIVALEVLGRPLAGRVLERPREVVVLGSEDPPHHAVVDWEGDHVGDDLDAYHVAGRDVEVVADLRRD